MLFDLIIVAVIAVFVIIGISRGAVKSIANLLVFVLASMLALYIGKLTSNWIYDTYVYNDLVSSVTNVFQNGSGADLSKNIADFTNGVPKTVSALLAQAGIDFSLFFKQVFSGSADMISKAVETTLRPCIVTVLTVLLTSVYFILFSVLLKIAVHFVNKIAMLPVLSFINRIFGGVIGFLYGCIFVMFVILLIKLLMNYNESVKTALECLKINNSYIFNAVLRDNILNGVLDFIN